MAKSIGFSEYANFRYSDSAPNLPLDPNLTSYDPERRISTGAFSLTYPLNHTSVVKVTRLLRLGEKTNNWFPQHSDIIPYLVSKSDAGDKVNFEKAVAVAHEYAEVRNQTYEVLKTYLDPHLPTLRGQAIFDSPRRILEKLIAEGRGESEKIDWSQVPNSEIAVMEIWQRIDSRNSFHGRSLSSLVNLFQNQVFRAQMSDFANRSKRLFDQQQIMVDICDGRGIRGVSRSSDDVLGASENNHYRFNIETPAQMQRYLDLKHQENAVIFPANSCWDNEKVILFDTFPIDQVPQVDIHPIAEAVRLNNFETLKSLAFVRNGGAVMSVARYLFLLKEMGAEI